MTLSMRLTMAMVGLVLFAIAVTGVLTHRNLLDVAVPRSLQRLSGHVELVAAELQAVVSAARADVLAFAVEQMVNGGSGEIADASNVFAAAERRQLTSRFAAELTAQPWYDEWRIVGAEDGGREVIRVDRSGAGGASRAAPEAELQRDGDHDYFQKTIALAAGAVYISPIELKQTHGATGTAHVPSMRVAAPLIAADGRRFAIVIADLDLRPVFDRIRATARRGSRIYVVNEAGDFLLHPDPNREFAFARGSPARVQDDFPALTELLQGDDAMPRVLDDRAGERFGVAWQKLRLGGGPRVAAIETLPYPALIAGATAVRDSGVIAALAAVLVAFVLAVVTARSMTKPLA
jgi:NADH:ubiquinone oxidoreductase subunit K